MFQFTGLALHCWSDWPSASRVVPFGNLRVKRLYASNRSLSQLTTSFFAAQCQGIHHTPLFCFKKLLKTGHDRSSSNYDNQKTHFKVQKKVCLLFFLLLIYYKTHQVRLYYCSTTSYLLLTSAILRQLKIILSKNKKLLSNMSKNDHDLQD